MWQEQQKKKKLYKNWKLYATALAIILIGAGTGLGIYYGINANHSEVVKTNLNALGLETTIIGTQDIKEDDAFNTFLEANKDTLGENLTRDQVELSNFQTIGILQNGTLTITVKEGSKSKFTGSINITLKYTLNDTNIVDIIKYLSNNNLLNFKVPVGSPVSGSDSNNLMAQVTYDFRAAMNNYYVYGNNINNISLVSASYKPTQEQLNTIGTVWTPPKNSTLPDGTKVSSLWVQIRITYNDKSTKFLTAYNLNATITVVE